MGGRTPDPSVYHKGFDLGHTEEVTDRFNGLDLMDRVPEELWMEVHNIIQGGSDQNHLKEK